MSKMNWQLYLSFDIQINQTRELKDKHLARRDLVDYTSGFSQFLKYIVS